MTEDWKTYKLSELVTLLGDGIHGTPKYSDHGEYYFINGNNLVDGKILIKPDTKRVSKDEYLKHKRELNDRTLLVSINGTIGRTAYYNEEKVMLGKSACYFNIKEGVEKRYIKQVISSKYFIDYLESNYTGSVIKNVSLKSMRELPINLPPLPEQRAIASILSSLDDKIELNLQMNKTLEEMAKALYKHWFVDFGPFQNGKFVDSELGMIPEGWEVKRLEQLVSKLGDGIHGTPKYTIDGEYYFINGNNIINGRIYIKNDTKRVSKEEFEKHKRELNNRTILVSINGTIGNIGVYGGEKIMLGKSACYFNVKEDISMGFIKQVLSSNYFTNYLEASFTGSVIKNVSLKSMREFPIIIPPFSEQSRFKDITDSMVLMQNELHIETQTLTTLRDTLLPKLISGEVRVMDVEKLVHESL